jgi:hypothetical protein
VYEIVDSFSVLCARKLIVSLHVHIETEVKKFILPFIVKKHNEESFLEEDKQKAPVKSSRLQRRKWWKKKNSDADCVNRVSVKKKIQLVAREVGVWATSVSGVIVSSSRISQIIV